jgi:hypothetical protein
MTKAGLSPAALAVAVGCHLKTAQRWFYEGRLPRPGHMQKVAAALGTSAGWLWPSGVRTPIDALGDHMRFFDQLDGEPELIVDGMVMSARRGLAVCSGSQWFLQMATTRILRRRQRASTKVLVPPGITWNGAASPRELGIEFRTHTGVGQLSLLRGDDAMILVNAIGMETASAPALFLSRTCDGGAFDRYALGFEALWAQAFDGEYEEAGIWRGGDA